MNWVKELAAAGSRKDTLRIVNEYLAGLDEGLRTPYGVPARVQGAEEVFPLHRRLVERSQASPDDEELQELAVFFLRAAARLTEVDGDDGDGSSGTSGNDGHFSVRGNGGTRSR